MAQGKTRDKEEMALILAESKLFGYEQTARRNDISSRTIYNWRKKLDEDQELTELFREKERYLQFRWIEKLPIVIEQAMDCVTRCLEEAPRDSKTLDSAIRALELGSQMQISLKARQDELEAAGIKINREGS